MNKQRRKDIDTIIQNLEGIREQIQMVLEEEQEYLDNIPENLQNSDRYETAETAVQELEEADGSIDDIIEHLENAKYGM